jgi:succinylornithine aminotransferase
VLRFAPSLIMPMADLDEGFARIEKAIAELAH